MRKLIVTTIVSLDGYSAGPGGDVMAMPMDHAFDDYNIERLRAAGTLLLGAKTYTGFKTFWPGRADAPDARGNERETSRRNDAIDKVVVSDSLTDADTDPWTDTTEIVRRADAHERIAQLKKGDGGDILMFGSGTLWNDLLAAGLVDELHLMIGPAVLGGGTPAFGDDGVTAALELVDTRRFEGSDNLLVRYAVRR